MSRAHPGAHPLSEGSRCSGVAASALRFYEERGLIRSERAGSGHRRYSRDVLRRIAFIVFAPRIGMSPGEGGAGIAQPPAGPGPEGEGLAEVCPSRGRGSEAHITAL